MDLLDKLALSNRHYDRRKAARTGDEKFSLHDLLETFQREAILELKVDTGSKKGQTIRPDVDRKFKVSLLDAVSDLGLPGDAWFYVEQTAPSGDLSKVRILAHDGRGERQGTIDLLLGRRSYDHYFEEDPVLGEITRSQQAR